MTPCADRFALGHGACVVVELVDVDAALAGLAADEQRRAEALPVLRRAPYIAGRTALRLALGDALRASAARMERAASSPDPASSAAPPAPGAAGWASSAVDPTASGTLASAAGAMASGAQASAAVPIGSATGMASAALTMAIGSDDRGAPILPSGWVGSVSHKGARAAALVAPAGVTCVGVDLEVAAPPRQDIARRILTAREQAALPDRGRAVTRSFAIKEAIYKAIDPYERRYVGFLEVELAFAGEVVAVSTALPYDIEATWREHAGHWLATARARRR